MSFRSRLNTLLRITSDRPYSHAWNKDNACQELRAQAGKHFDPNVVKVFLGLDIE